jgi:UDPglucose 6-dehydrogenase
VQGADALAVVTEWNEFRSPDFRRLKELLKSPIIFDGRNVYETGVMKRYGFEHHPIGRPASTPASA